MPLDEKTLERLVQEQRLAGPKRPAAEIKEATELFEEYVRPAQPGEPPKSKGLRAQGYSFPPPGGPAPPMTHANIAKGIMLPPAPPTPAPVPPPKIAAETTELFEEYHRPDPTPAPAPAARPTQAPAPELPAFPEPETAPSNPAIPTGEAEGILRGYEPPVPQVHTPKRFTILPPLPPTQAAPVPAPAVVESPVVESPTPMASLLAPPEPLPEPEPEDDPRPEAPAVPAVAVSTPHRSDAPPLSPGSPVQLGIVQAEFNRDITDAMASEARDEARRLGCPVTAHARVPGVFDTPLAVKTFLQRPDVEAVVVIGCVIQGETGHDELITHAAAKQLLELACQFEKPVALGVTGPRMTREQAMARIGSGAFAVASAVAQARLLRTA